VCTPGKDVRGIVWNKVMKLHVAVSSNGGLCTSRR
jgi:hypothetical protein